MLDALAKKPHTLAELAAMPELFGEDVTSLAEVAAVPVMSEQGATYFPASAKMEPDATHRMSRALALQVRHDDNYQVLASPLLGNGVTAGLVIMAAQGLRITRESEPMETEVAELTKTVKAILELRVPIWRQRMVL
jgi:hypothetical protein